MGYKIIVVQQTDRHYRTLKLYFPNLYWLGALSNAVCRSTDRQQGVVVLTPAYDKDVTVRAVVAAVGGHPRAPPLVSGGKTETSAGVPVAIIRGERE